MKKGKSIPMPVAGDMQEWQTEEDARTLGRHAEITSDKKRHAAAMKKAEAIAADHEKKAGALRKATAAKPAMKSEKVADASPKYRSKA